MRHRSCPVGLCASPAGAIWVGPALHVCLPVAAGALIYVLFRSDQLLVFRWIDALGWADAARAARVLAAPARALVPNAVLYSAPDALWSYAWVALMRLIWRGHAGLAPALWAAAGPGLAVATEVAQWAGTLRGHADTLDLLAYVFGAAAARAATPSRTPLRPDPPPRPTPSGRCRGS